MQISGTGASDPATCPDSLLDLARWTHPSLFNFSEATRRQWSGTQTWSHFQPPRGNKAVGKTTATDNAMAERSLIRMPLFHDVGGLSGIPLPPPIASLFVNGSPSEINHELPDKKKTILFVEEDYHQKKSSFFSPLVVHLAMGIKPREVRLGMFRLQGIKVQLHLVDIDLSPPSLSMAEIDKWCESGDARSST